MVAAYHHIQRIKRLKACDHGCYERVPCNFGEDIAFVANMFDLL